MVLRNLRGLNLSHNSLGREIPSKIGDLTSLESLDLSNNNLVRRIPNSPSNLYCLSHLNLFNNNLSGPIPTGSQLQTLEEPSSYEGNPQLCGAPLPKRCPSHEPPKDSNTEDDAADDGDSMDKLWFCVFVVGGFGIGFWGFVGFLVFKRSFRQAYFHCTDEMGSKILLAGALFAQRFSELWSSCVAKNTSIGCIAVERKALLKFKSSLDDPSNITLPSWRGIDCCTWEGITCDEITGLRKFVDLNLESNNLDHASDWISEFLSGKCHLESLSLQNNSFHGKISRVFKNISGCSSQNLLNLNMGYNNFDGDLPSELDKVKKITNLDLSRSNISGQIPESLGNLSFLRGLIMRDNKLVGPIPSSIGKLKVLWVLDLSSNRLSGEIPISFGQLSNLESLDISHNSFNGTISEVHFVNLSKLEKLYLSNNLINFKFGCSWVPSFQLTELNMASSNVGGQIPRWLQSQMALSQLDLSNCNISETLPKWLGNMNLVELDLSKNHIYGTIPNLSSSLTSLDLSDNIINHLPSNIDLLLPYLEYLLLARNSINGSLPDSLCNMSDLTLLVLSMNGFSGYLPDCWQDSYLSYLDLSSNELSGIIPESIGAARYLSWLHLNNNTFTGQIPSTLQNSTYLEVLDVGENMLSGRIPEWIRHNMLDLKILRLRSNQFQGVIPHTLCQASQLQVLDIGNNNLTGYIPRCVGNFSGMIEKNHLRTRVVFLRNLRGLNLSHNFLDREIPSKIGELTSLESLDLSNNNLVGRIPNSLSNLYLLSRLNLSNNNLSGAIPTGNQLQTLDDPSIYDGNPQLCGAPLLKRCPGNKPTKDFNPENDAADDGDSRDKILFSAFVVGGFGTGFWGFVGLLVFKRSFRQAYYRFVEEMGSKILLAAALFARRFSGN
ncbi:receptor-like protein EIX2 [Andrographis paniculata]|uniref:receptor-like protein EIX2 n=1 Tax=Andrographis paniculata TaxID=175694 RepID=UPI0021E82E32|nr:receptor-like protein EIX2 [Andrographis paniculata]